MAFIRLAFIRSYSRLESSQVRNLASLNWNSHIRKLSGLNKIKTNSGCTDLHVHVRTRLRAESRFELSYGPIFPPKFVLNAFRKENQAFHHSE